MGAQLASNEVAEDGLLLLQVIDGPHPTEQEPKLAEVIETSAGRFAVASNGLRVEQRVPFFGFGRVPVSFQIEMDSKVGISDETPTESQPMASVSKAPMAKRKSPITDGLCVGKHKRHADDTQVSEEKTRDLSVSEKRTELPLAKVTQVFERVKVISSAMAEALAFNDNISVAAAFQKLQSGAISHDLSGGQKGGSKLADSTKEEDLGNPFRYHSDASYGRKPDAVAFVGMPSDYHKSAEWLPAISGDEIRCVVNYEIPGFRFSDAKVAVCVVCREHCTVADIIDAIHPYLTHWHSRRMRFLREDVSGYDCILKLSSTLAVLKSQTIEVELKGDISCLQLYLRSAPESTWTRRKLCSRRRGECPLRKSVIAEVNAERSEELLRHWDEFDHNFDTAVCELADRCPVYVRRVEGRDSSTELADRWHMETMRHPLHAVDEKEQFNDVITLGYILEPLSDNSRIRLFDSFRRFNWDITEALKGEFKRNGFEHALHLKEAIGDTSALTERVVKKLRHPKHEQMGSPLSFVEMMAVVLYTEGVGVNELNAATRNEHRAANPWIAWNSILCSALRKLTESQILECKVYRGVSGVRLPEDLPRHKLVVNFPQFTSATLDKDYALGCVRGGGLLLEFDETQFVADISWISRFPEQKEVVFVPRNGNSVMEAIGTRDSIEHVRIHSFFLKRPQHFEIEPRMVYQRSDTAPVSRVGTPTFKPTAVYANVLFDEVLCFVQFEVLGKTAQVCAVCREHCTLAAIIDAIRHYLGPLQSRELRMYTADAKTEENHIAHTLDTTLAGLSSVKAPWYKQKSSGSICRQLFLEETGEIDEANIVNIDAQRDVCPLAADCPLSEEVIAESEDWMREELLQHLDTFRHFPDTTSECKLADECPVYLRLIEESDSGTLLADRWHIANMRHPLRPRVAEHFSVRFSDRHRDENIPLTERLNGSHWDYTEALMREFKRNDFERALFLQNGVTNTTALMERVREKMRHPMHARMGAPLSFVEMMAVVLYTRVSGVRSLNAATRNEGNEANPWVLWKTCLSSALKKLEKRQRRKSKVFRGMYGLHLPAEVRRFRDAQRVIFPQFVSTSLDETVAMTFTEGRGLFLAFDGQPETAQSFGAEISWISHFAEEKEILFAPNNGSALMEQIVPRPQNAVVGVEYGRVHPFEDLPDVDSFAAHFEMLPPQ